MSYQRADLYGQRAFVAVLTLALSTSTTFPAGMAGGWRLFRCWQANLGISSLIIPLPNRLEWSQSSVLLTLGSMVLPYPVNPVPEF